MAVKGQASRKIRFAHIAHDGVSPVAYELWSGSCDVVFDGSDVASVSTSSVSAFRIEGLTRTQLTVNGSGSAYEVWLRRWPISGSELPPAKRNSITAADLRTLRTARFDLLPAGVVSQSLTYSESRILASRQVNIIRDGKNGENGAYISTVFVRSPQKPPTPVGGTYSSPYPTSKVTVGSEQRPWSDTALSGTDPVWLSRAIFLPTHTSSSPAWSDPVPAVDSTDIEFIWSTKENPGSPGGPPFDPSSPGDWSKNATDATWMAVAVKNNGVWGAWDIIRVKGEGGRNAVTATLDPGIVELKMGQSSLIYVYLEVNDGETPVKPDGVSSLNPNNVGSEGTVTEGLQWWWLTDWNGRMAYRLLYSGSSDINIDRVIKMSYKGVDYYRTLQIRTVADGAPGESVKGDTGPYCPPPQQWQDYPPGYEFQDGSEGCTRMDTVFCGVDAEGKMISYKCIRSHKKGLVKTDSGGPVNDRPDVNCQNTVESLRVWRKGSSYHLISTDVLLAVNAYIKLLSSQGIRIYDSAGRIVGQLSAINGDNVPSSDGTVLPFFVGGIMEEDGAFSQSPLFAVDTMGRTYHGGTTGQRIVIDPVSKRLLVHDSTGDVCAVHSGDDIDYVAIKNLTSATDTKTADVPTLSDSGVKVLTYPLPALTVTPTADGTMTVVTPPVKLEVSGTLAPPRTGIPSSSRTSELYLDVLAGGTFAASRLVGGTATPADGGSMTVTTGSQTLTANVSKGVTYTVRLRYVLNVTGSAKCSSAGKVTRTVKVRMQMCHYGRNGWVVMSDSANYSYCIFDDDGMHMRIVKGGQQKFDTDL